MRSLYSYLKEVKDHRRLQGQRIPMAAFLEMIVLAGMSGRFGIREISRFIKNNEKFFVERYGLKHGTPAYATVRNFISQLDTESLLEAFHKWSMQYIEPDDWVAIDGKAMGSTVTNSHNSSQNYKSMVSMFCGKKGIVIHSKSFENKKEHEGITAVELIETCELKGITFTMDALHCQKKL